MAKYSVLILLILMRVSCSAQVTKKKELGLRVAYGVFNTVLPEKDIYRPILILPYFNYYLSKREKRSKFSVYVEPQITPVRVKYKSTGQEDWEKEIGINGGFSYSYWFNWFTIYVGIGSGPNYISVVTKKQANGFIFSDNIYAGIKREIKNNYFLDIHIRGRHISNAGLKNPNYGINNAFGGLGFSKFF
jgi:hypothetical protein